MVRLGQLVVVATVTVVLAAGCGGASHTRTTTAPAGKYPIVDAHPSVTTRGIPPAVVSQLQGDKAVLLPPSRVAFMTKGTVNCAWWPQRLTVLGPRSIVIDMRVNGVLATCGNGAVGFPVAVRLDPRDVNVHESVTVRLAYKVRLPGSGGVHHWSRISVAPAVGRR